MSVTDTPAFVAEWQAWHQAHEARLAAPDGFLAITDLRWLDGRPQRFDDLPGTWSADGAGVQVVLAAGESLRLDDEPQTGRVAIAIDERGSRWVRVGDRLTEVARRGGRYLLRPRDPDAPLRRHFTGTPAYVPDPAYVVRGSFVAYDTPRPTEVGSVVDGLTHVYDAVGEVRFALHGEALSLVAFGGDALTILFTDATSGRTTYAANRVLRVAPPDADGTVVLDFTRATNLPCAYTDLATCPLPPAGNRLPVPVEAGEQLPYERRG